MLTYKKTQDPNLAYALPNGRYALKNGVPITGDDIAAVLAEYNLEVVEGDAVFVYTGFQHVHDFDKATEPHVKINVTDGTRSEVISFP